MKILLLLLFSALTLSGSGCSGGGSAASNGSPDDDQLVLSGENIKGFDRSPQGEYVTSSLTAEGLTVNLNNGEKSWFLPWKTYKQGHAVVKFSPNGRKIAFVRQKPNESLYFNSGQFVLYNRDTKEERLISSPDTPAAVPALDWLDDYTLVYMTAGPKEDDPTKLATMDLLDAQNVQTWLTFQRRTYIYGIDVNRQTGTVVLALKQHEAGDGKSVHAEVGTWTKTGYREVKKWEHPYYCYSVAWVSQDSFLVAWMYDYGSQRISRVNIPAKSATEISVKHSIPAAEFQTIWAPGGTQSIVEVEYVSKKGSIYRHYFRP